MKPVRLLQPARHEMLDAAGYYELQAPGLGEDFLNRIEFALTDISIDPERWPVLFSGIRRRLVRRFPYSILYRVDKNAVVVLAIMHQKRRPEYWLSRNF
jgi:plasmid stabilization system protein ParE